MFLFFKTNKRFIILFLFSCLLPMFVLAADAGLVPCGLNGTDDCNFTALKQLVQNIFRFLLYTILFPITTIVILYTGMQTVLLSVQGKDNSIYKNRLKNIVIGFALALGSYAIVMTLISLFFDTSGDLGSVIKEIFGGN